MWMPWLRAVLAIICHIPAGPPGPMAAGWYQLSTSGMKVNSPAVPERSTSTLTKSISGSTCCSRREKLTGLPA
jgi:hypothetical protein